MRRLSRNCLQRPYLVNLESLCVFCQTRTSFIQSQSRSLSTTRPSQKEKVTFLERTRRRIWGTDEPPGYDDPYTGQNLRETKTLGEEEKINPEKEEWQRQVDEARQHPEYKPAQTWDGLEIVGGDKDYATGDRYENYLGDGRIISPNGVRLALHRTLVEVFTICSSDLSLSDNLPDAPVDPSVEGSELFESVSIKPSADGQGATLNFPSQDSMEEIQAYLQNPDGGSYERRTEDVNEAMREWALHKDEILEKASAWFPISLQDRQVKFAVQKRFSQLIGEAIPDPLITRCSTAGELYMGLMDRLVQPTKLYQEIQFGAASELLALDNVQVYNTRQTPIDKERKMGRLKVINRELERQGLPLLGEKVESP